ncbi:NifU-like protein [Acholeplasma oculi]|uniref:Iron-sulfur cluster assembly SUF system, SufE n=1 Tax=Acholeplasma oculi TaxID=35623 RepID=A0A061AHA2_9MOLU|nr:SUF system NifU family Fe-S cluster assembly protein [Acholeplasma oculi]CDR30352.1 Iron-sulfur cluster assembly SUF system, SufE [Acholeplasma oculi]SKC42364.1 nitrogen fixation protein NifU [Acholeplasma oculi]SUT88853.1 NifU-like protein [Acholeplasma oculi]
MDLKTLYREVIMDHYKYPKHKGLLNDETYLTVQLNNPTCGDDLIVQLLVENGVIKDLRQQGKGCSICCASASVAASTLIGLTIDKALETILEFYEMIKGEPFDQQLMDGDVLAFQSVHQFPARIKCATLAWKAYEKGLLPLKGDTHHG